MTESNPQQPAVPGSSGIYAVLPLRDIVVFPHMVAPLFVGREKSIRALEEVARNEQHILLETMYDLPGLDSVEQVVIGPEVVEGKAKPLFIHGDRSDQTASASA